jgi:hypothetical protein
MWVCIIVGITICIRELTNSFFFAAILEILLCWFLPSEIEQNENWLRVNE